MKRTLFSGGRTVVCGVAWVCASTWAAGAAAAATVASSAASGAARHARAAVPAANFFVEWRIRPASASASSGGGQPGAVFTSRSAATGGSAFGTGAVVVGTAQAAGGDGTQGLAVANGEEGRLALDRPESRKVYDLAWIASEGGRNPHEGMPTNPSVHPGGTSSHDEVVHRVQALRVVPRWTHGEMVPLEIGIVRQAQADGESALDLRTTMQAPLGAWTRVARLGGGDDELQVRVTWR
ncbi:MAG TPA: hypothetical protein VH328_10855 [Burkholderiaceae bacterium]|nr:hypothetical protein [Burkholderiaceae bacterium]